MGRRFDAQAAPRDPPPRRLSEYIVARPAMAYTTLGSDAIIFANFHAIYVISFACLMTRAPRAPFTALLSSARDSAHAPDKNAGQALISLTSTRQINPFLSFFLVRTISPDLPRLM